MGKEGGSDHGIFLPLSGLAVIQGLVIVQIFIHSPLHDSQRRLFHFFPRFRPRESGAKSSLVSFLGLHFIFTILACRFVVDDPGFSVGVCQIFTSSMYHGWQFTIKLYECDQNVRRSQEIWHECAVVLALR
jgi:hypothetical protein